MVEYIYTPAPLPPIDTLNSHFLFYIALVVTVVWVAFFVTKRDIPGKAKLVAANIAVVFLGIFALVSWNTGEIIERENIVVYGTMDGVFAAVERSGKHHVNNGYVTYVLDGDLGMVTFRAKSGAAYPERAVFYRNVKRKGDHFHVD